MRKTRSSTRQSSPRPQPDALSDYVSIAVPCALVMMLASHDAGSWMGEPTDRLEMPIREDLGQQTCVTLLAELFLIIAGALACAGAELELITLRRKKGADDKHAASPASHPVHEPKTPTPVKQPQARGVRKEQPNTTSKRIARGQQHSAKPTPCEPEEVSASTREAEWQVVKRSRPGAPTAATSDPIADAFDLSDVTVDAAEDAAVENATPEEQPPPAPRQEAGMAAAEAMMESGTAADAEVVMALGWDAAAPWAEEVHEEPEEHEQLSPRHSRLALWLQHDATCAKGGEKAHTETDCDESSQWDSSELPSDDEGQWNSSATPGDDFSQWSVLPNEDDGHAGEGEGERGACEVANWSVVPQLVDQLLHAEGVKKRAAYTMGRRQLELALHGA